MEASDAFAQEIAGGDDPFAEDFGELEPPQDPGAQPADGAEAPVEEPPIVNREGERIDAPAETNGTAPDPTATPTGETAPGGASEGGPAKDPTSPGESAGPTEAAQADPTTPSGGDPTPEADPTPVGSQTSQPAEPEQTTGPSAGEPASTSESAPEGSPSSGGEPREQVQDAEEPKETEDKSGRKTKRRYLIFHVDGPGKLSQVHWYEDSKGKLAQRGGGNKRQTVCLARGTDDALKFGYAACGSPANGVKLVAVAKLHFQPRDVKPRPPEPMRQKLTIS